MFQKCRGADDLYCTCIYVLVFLFSIFSTRVSCLAICVWICFCLALCLFYFIAVWHGFCPLGLISVFNWVYQMA